MSFAILRPSSSRPAGPRKPLSLLWVLLLVASILIPVAALNATLAPRAEANTGTSPDGRISLSKVANTRILAPGGGPVSYTYTVRNLSQERLFYEGLVDNRCAAIKATGGLDSGPAGSSLAPGAQATFTCSTEVTATTTNTAEATFSDVGGNPSVASAQETVTVQQGAMACSEIWYGSIAPDGAATPGTLGIATINGLTKQTTVTTRYNNSDYYTATAVAINPRDKQ